MSIKGLFLDALASLGFLSVSHSVIEWVIVSAKSQNSLIWPIPAPVGQSSRSVRCVGQIVQFMQIMQIMQFMQNMQIMQITQIMQNMQIMQIL